MTIKSMYVDKMKEVEYALHVVELSLRTVKHGDDCQMTGGLFLLGLVGEHLFRERSALEAMAES